MQDPPNAGALFHAGRLDEAIAAANARLRREPRAAGARVLLGELLLFSGNLERADLQLDTAGTLDPSLGIAMEEFRQLLRAEHARGQLLSEGRVPGFLESGPTPAQREALACVVALRSGDVAEAAGHAITAETLRPAAPFMANGERVDDIRDGDDLIAGSLEVLTATGQYLWIPFERVLSLTFQPPQRPRDLYWRRASLEVVGGPSGEVRVPAIYPLDLTNSDDNLRLGRATEWHEMAEGLTRGVGQRMFMGGEDGLPVMTLTTLTRT